MKAKLVLCLLAGGSALMSAEAAEGPSVRELSLGLAAKILCSSVFITGLDADAALELTVYPALFVDGLEPGDITGVDVDETAKRVRLEAEGAPARTAALYGDQGCVLHPTADDRIYFKPVDLKPASGARAGEPWPIGEASSNGPLPDGLDRAALDAALAPAFEAESHTAGVVVVYKGRIVAERYGDGADEKTRLVSWSMGKSLTATLLGVLAEQQGGMDLFAPAPVPEWSGPGDPRGAIRTADLLRMSSGLRFTSTGDPKETWAHNYPDHFLVYSGAIDAFDFAVNRDLEFPPNTVGRYRNSDPLTIGYVVQQVVEARGGDYFSFPQTDLFDRIGIESLVLEPDPYGNFLMTGFEYGRPRDWARLGLLHLRNGDWFGERILPEDWAAFVSTPAPAWEQPVYGGLFWLNPKEGGRWRLPEDAYYMAGAGGQFTIIVPSLDLVVVRMGHFKGGQKAEASLNAAFELLLPEIERVRKDL